MNFRLVVTVLAVAVAVAVAALPLAAHAQQPNTNQPNPPTGPKPTASDVQRVVGAISSDTVKRQAYCDMVKLDDQIAQAERAKDTKKAEDLARQADQMAQKLGPDYVKLMDNLQQVDPSSTDGQKLVAVFEPLDKLCMSKQ